ncbi:hypothetical protein DPX16_16932 [Anabarilius grahami]|uniref:Uncharacterized protein n=1 Tax=Anabarilius grahami TaxID=495550 RepID=A0A3N0YMF3_ANAGA|nr:hypothetical protein DPX16_16932 [Anabarilius grahami]
MGKQGRQKECPLVAIIGTPADRRDRFAFLRLTFHMDLVTTRHAEFLIKRQLVLQAVKIHHSQTAIDVNVKTSERPSQRAELQNAQQSTQCN